MTNTLQSSCCATALRKASRRLTQFYDTALAPCGLRSTQYSILSELDRRAKNPPAMTELAEALVLDRSALGHNLGPLERDGYLTLEENPNDRRSRLVTLTTEGKAKHREAKRLWKTAQDKFLKTFGVDEAEELRNVLLSIADDVRLKPGHDMREERRAR